MLDKEYFELIKPEINSPSPYFLGIQKHFNYLIFKELLCSSAMWIETY